jgi:hypothetical protein
MAYAIPNTTNIETPDNILVEMLEVLERARARIIELELIIESMRRH